MNIDDKLGWMRTHGCLNYRVDRHLHRVEWTARYNTTTCDVTMDASFNTAVTMLFNKLSLRLFTRCNAS